MEEKRGICGQDGCRETRYYLESGLWFCRQGHQQEGRQVIADDDDFGTQGKTTRQKKVVTERLSKKYSGSQAYQLFLEVYQLILWKQCYALIHNRGLPAELELIVKELWTLRLQKLYEKDDDILYSDDNTPRLFSSQTEETELEQEENRYHKKKLTDSPKVIDSLALCYLGILLLRVPVSIGYLLRWIDRDDVPYLRLSRFVPQEMKDRLPAVYQTILEPINVPSGDRLHRAVFDLADVYRQFFGVVMPPLNSPLYLFSYIKQLALPLEIFFAVNSLKQLARFEFGWSRKPGKFNQLFLPEVQLMTLVIIATKLLYPFDGTKRYPNSPMDPSAQILDWGKWVEAQQDFDSRGLKSKRIGKGHEIHVTEEDIMRMTSVQLDDYMDWYGKMWVEGRKGGNPFVDMFPTNRVDTENIIPMLPPDNDDDSSEISDKLHKLLYEMRMGRVVTDAHEATLPEPVPRPGSSYERYRHENQLPETAKAFYKAAAGVIGVSLETIISTTYQAEHRVSDSDGRRKSVYKAMSRSRAKSRKRDVTIIEDVAMAEAGDDL